MDCSLVGVFKLIYNKYIRYYCNMYICFQIGNPIKHRPFSVIMHNESIYDRSDYIPITEIKEEITETFCNKSY